MIEGLMGTADPVLGIDLGTTTSCVSLLREGVPRVLADHEGHRITPSLVAMTPQGELVGAEARSRLVTDPDATVYSFKRLLGRRFDDPRVRVAVAASPFEVAPAEGGGIVIRIRGGEYSVPEIASRVLGRLRAIAERALGGPARKAVIAVPASFDDAQRGAVKLAGRIAGLDVVRLVNEPAAAALAFGFHQRKPGTLCVFDFGGGTFDVTLLAVEEGEFKVLAAAGDSLLGGDDLDMALAFAAAEAFRVETGKNLWRDVAEWQRLLFACEQAKRRLSTEARSEIRLRAVARTPTGVRDLVYWLDRRRFQQICGDKVEQTLRCCSEALAQSGLEPTAVDSVLLVGGSTFVRLVRTRVADFFGCSPDISVDPAEAVAVGAAIEGALWAGQDVCAPQPPRLLEVASRAVAISVDGGGPVVVFGRNEPVPAVDRRTVTTSANGQRVLGLHVLQRHTPAEWRVVGELFISDLPAASAGQVAVEVITELDGNGELKVRLVEAQGHRSVTAKMRI
jgi:molecular chaperone DnaK